MFHDKIYQNPENVQIVFGCKLKQFVYHIIKKKSSAESYAIYIHEIFSIFINNSTFF